MSNAVALVSAGRHPLGSQEMALSRALCHALYEFCRQKTGISA